ncbi:MAG: sugar kinase, ribokinase [Verrucomicrobiales bacterium]|nr:sugar kinase, ribokinase [Verrucomicrobiales bacterium]
MSFNIIGLGEVLWDLLPSGRQLGGAPANFAWHAHALGARAQIVSRVGNDDLGTEIRQRLQRMELPDTLVQTDPSHPTGTVTVALAANGVPEYIIHESVAWDHIASTPEAFGAVRSADAICFGSLAQRTRSSRESIQTLVSAAPSNALRIFDINLRQHYFDRETIETSLKLANVLKLNDDELPILTKLSKVDGAVKSQIEFIAKRFDLGVIALTRGGNGSLLYHEGRWSEHGSINVAVADTIGAGDSFTAALCLGLLRGLDLDRINAAANQIAAFVCSVSGATPELPAHLRELLR